MLAIRTCTAIFLIGILTPIFIWAPLNVINIFIAFVLAIAAWEWSGLFKLSQYWRIVYSVVVGGVFFGLLKVDPLFFLSLLYPTIGFWLFFVPFALWRGPILLAKGAHIFFLVIGVLVLPLFGCSVSAINQIGKRFLFSVVLVVCLGDMGAFFVGRLVGGVKLAPRISPNKTWSGFVGACVLIIFVLLIVLSLKKPWLFVREMEMVTGLVFSKSSDVFKAIVFAVLLFLLSVLGDLFESLIKRQAGVKDSSSLLPGHGGVLDRIDSLLPVLPLVMFFLS